jgi:hypothetical protein
LDKIRQPAFSDDLPIEKTYLCL